MLKGTQTAHRLVFALHSSVSKLNQWKIFIKISILDPERTERKTGKSEGERGGVWIE